MYYIKLKGDENDESNEMKMNQKFQYANFYKPINDRGTRFSYSSFKFYLILSMVIFMLITLISVTVTLNYRNNLFKTNHYWTDLAVLKSEKPTIYTNKICLKKSINIDTIELIRFMDYLNDQFYFNYFVCFSSLYFMVKVEEYRPYRSSLLTNKKLFQNQNEKCIMGDNTNNQTNIHMCHLRQSKFSICKFVDRYNKINNANLNCNYNYLNGEYSIDINENIKLTFHEFRMKFKNIHSMIKYYLNTKIYGFHSSMDYDEYIDDKASLDNGFMTNLFDTQYFSIPLYLFYTQQSRINGNYIYVNYANSTFRLPSDIVDYFMIFYSKIWFL